MSDSDKNYKSGTALLEHLRATGSSPERIAMVEAFLRESPGASAVETIEWMRGQGWEEHFRGTVVKAGRFVHGEAFVVARHGEPGESPTEELEAREQELKRRKADLEDECRRLDAEHGRLTVRNKYLEKLYAETTKV